MGKSKRAARKAKAETHEHHELEPTDESMAPTEKVPLEPELTTRKAKKKSLPKPAREERNGVKRPGPGKCLEVWEYLDQHGDMQANNLKPVAGEKGWNQNNALIELYGWRRFNGIARTALK